MKRVLVADGFDMMRNLTKAVLEDGGYEVIEAGSGEELLRVAASDHPDLILLDYKLAETARYLRSNPRLYFVPILVMCPHHEHLDWFTPVTAFTNGAIDKTRLVADLLDCVDMHLRLTESHYKRVDQMDGLEQTVAELKARQGELENKLEQSEAIIRALLDAVSSHCSIVDKNADIVAVNLAWKQFAEANGADQDTRDGVGKNYLEVCRQAAGPNSDEAPEVFNALQSLMNAGLNQFTLEYPCHSPEEKRWFLLDMRPVGREGGVIIMHHRLRSEPH